jgi:hypothetical protein
MSEVARKYREIAARLLELAQEVATGVERDACIAFAMHCLNSARAIEDHNKLARTLRCGAEWVVKSDLPREQADSLAAASVRRPAQPEENGRDSATPTAAGRTRND